MRDNGTDPQRKILSEIYKTSSNSAIIPAWIVAVFEVFFLINTCANPRYSTEHLVHYRFLYAFLLITTLLYIGLNSYIKENFEKRGSLTPQIAETQYWVIFLRKFQNLVYRNAVLCYNRTRYRGGAHGETKQG